MGVYKNTYRKLDMDTAYNKRDPESYSDCRNFRIISNDQFKNGALSSVKGNIVVPGSTAYEDDYIIGSIKCRNSTIVFTTNDDTASPTASYGRIWKLPLGSDTITKSSFQLLYNGLLNLSRQNPIEDIQSFYENENIEKIYWTDNYNNFRFANIAEYLTDDGTITGSFLDPDSFNIIQDINLSTPVFTGMLTGRIPVGMVQYAYRLYKLYGPSSNFSPASPLIPLTTASISSAYSVKFKGAEQLDASGEPLSSGKGIKLSISGIDTDYDRIEVVAIHYNTLNGEPTIYIVNVLPVVSSINVVDEGNYNLGTYSLAEFTLLNNPFKCKTLTSKNNILFASNVSQSEFDFDFDARAYRWTFGRFCYLYEVNGEYWYNAAATSNQWTHYTAAGVAIETVASMALLPSTIDAINRGHNISSSYNGIWSRQSNGSTIGGEGPNVKYEFETTNFPLDTLNTAETFGTRSYIAPHYYEGLEAPDYNQIYRTFCRDEIYRVGLIGYDGKGRYSPVKWIGDIRTPNNYSHPFSESNTGNAINIKFTITNLPSEVKYVQIVYVKRTNDNKTVRFQGKLSFFRTHFSESYVVKPSESTITTYTTVSAQAPSYVNKHVVMFSPEISFYKNFNLGSLDYLELIGEMTGTITNKANNNSFQILKCNYFTAVSKSYIKINDARIEESNADTDAEHTQRSFGTLNTSSYNYRGRMIYNTNPTGTNIKYIGNLGICLLMNLNSALDVSWMTGAKYMLANYRSDLYGSQYGGYSYEDRTLNEYISAGDIASVSSGNSTAYASRGDVYISIADHLTGFYNKYYYDFGGSVRWLGAAEMFPVETVVNQPYRADDCYHRIYDLPEACYLIREKGNASFAVGTTDFTPGWTDLYLDNTVYERLPDARKYYAAPLDYEPEYSNDAIVMASDMKEGNETIDPWTRWATNETIVVNKSYGPINKIRSWKNFLLFWQENAVGALSVLDRSVISDQQGKSTSLGEGEILQRYDYISTNIGLNTRFSIAESLSGIYWYDHKRRTMHRFLNNIEDLSTIRGVNSYFSSLGNNYGEDDNVISTVKNGRGFLMTYNSYYNEIWLAVKDSVEYGSIIVYNEIINSFTGFIDTKVQHYLPYDNMLFSAYKFGIYKENVGYPGYFYGSYYDSYVTVIVNPVPNIVSTFTNFELTSEAYQANISADEFHVYIPTLSSTAASSITYNSATSGGNITNDGGSPVIERGVCYSTTSNPSIETSNKKSSGTGTGVFSVALTGLAQDTTYYLRAYATNGVGTGYGDEIEFTTSTGATNEIYDYDGNLYHTIIIGTQEWIVENLHVTHFADGISIRYLENYNWISGIQNTEGAYGYYNNSATIGLNDGYFYDWYAVHSARNIVYFERGGVYESGWRVPTKTDWQVLQAYLGGASIAGGKLKQAGTSMWVSPNLGATNETGFTALPGGIRTYGIDEQRFYYGRFWASTQYDSSNGDAVYLTRDSAAMTINHENKTFGMHIRCVKT